ncbi:MAG TPA: mechanosensitive ion channel family protein [Flavobacterium sp.]|jgi:small-conductance mechanosensitive channel
MITQKFVFEIIATIALLLLIVSLRIITGKLVRRYAKTSEILEHRTNLVIKYISILLTILGGIGVFVIWGVEAKNVFTTLSAVITVVGVALFAQWSVLSNITSGIILLFSFPFKIGDIIRIHDKDFPIEAEIEDIRSFHTLLKTREGETISYPNNLLLQKGVTVLKHYIEEKEFTD